MAAGLESVCLALTRNDDMLRALADVWPMREEGDHSKPSTHSNEAEKTLDRRPGSIALLACTERRRARVPSENSRRGHFRR